MTFDEWMESKYGKGWREMEVGYESVFDSPDMRAAWNAAVDACDDVVTEKHDPNEPWLEPGDLLRLLRSEPNGEQT